MTESSSQAPIVGLSTGDPIAGIRIELGVDVNHADDFKRIDQTLREKGYKMVESNLEAKTCKLEWLEGPSKLKTEPCDLQTLQKSVEDQTGFVTVIKGLGELNSAVVELRPSDESRRKGHELFGVVRLSQLNGNRCYVDAMIDATTRNDTGKFDSLSVAIHKYGDVSSDNLESIGGPEVHIADHLVRDESDRFSRFSIRRLLPNCTLPKMIGKSVAVTAHSRDNNSDQVLGAGIVARASTISANPKTVCSCSGKTIWQERLDKKSEEGNLKETI